ncbi:hypothetical protein GJAV_G00113630 [Gymnothorax javanicus]|nr:hypothetical protein GJAV_G00113630 [Gymnothorax javanicus]
MWNSTLEITAREEEAHASTYQRYDAGVDDNFVVDDDLYPQGSEGEYQGWGTMEGNSYDQQQGEQPVPESDDSNRTITQTSRPQSRGKRNEGLGALIADDELEYSPE